MRLNRRIPSRVLLCAGIAVAALPPLQAQEYRSDGAVRPERALSPDETGGSAVLSPDAVPPTPALPPD